MSQHKINRYVCQDKDCGGITVSVDLHEGTTPFMIRCRKCNSASAVSSFYRSSQLEDADIYWCRPTEGKFSQAEQEHIQKGGLLPFPTRQPLRPIRIQRQPNRATCLVTAFAMVLDVPVAELISQIGHDGMELIFPEAPEPIRYRGHHIQELMYACMERGQSVIQIEPIPVAVYGEVAKALEPVPWFEKCLLMRSGVLTGKSRGKEHAVAWNGVNTFDPTSRMIAPIGEFRIRSFFAVIPQSSTIRSS